MGMGKAQPLDTPVLTETGFRPMGSISVGDMVYGEDGQLHKVLGVYPQGIKEVYRVTFSDDVSTVCCADHLWTYQHPQDKPKNKWRTDSLREIMKHDLFKKTDQGDKTWQYFIPVTKPIEFSKRKLLINPHILGVMLGSDGADNLNSVVCMGARGGCSNNMLGYLRHYKLSGRNSRSKFIPEDYLMSSVNDRIELLRGLISVGGCVPHAGAVELHSASRALTEGVRWLVQSLGGTAVYVNNHTLSSSEREGCTSYNYYFRLYINLPIFNLPPTGVRCCDGLEDASAPEGGRRSIRKIEKAGWTECQCILVDNPSHLYITNDFIVTHNTSASIDYMNTHRGDKFIYITPYLDEATRIKTGCPKLHFVEPSDKLREFNFKKSLHTQALIDEGRNIATTHQAFKGYTPETLKRIKEQGYVLIIDENVDILESFEYSEYDLRMAVDAGLIKSENGIYSLTDKPYKGKALSELFRLLKSRELVQVKGANKETFFYWALPPSLITSFKETFILTYLFQGQSIRYFLDIYNIKYDFIGIEKRGDNSFRFGKLPGYTPDYISDIKNKLHIYDERRMNEIGSDFYALSMNWYAKKKDETETLKKNISNFFNNINRDIPADKRLWGVYKSEYNAMRGKGYSKSFLTFNAKATNDYRSRNCLVYITNLFMNVSEKQFYQLHGIEVDEDAYALSIMVQWIWRSAIRDGQDVYLYIPSSRMRNLLINWMNSLSTGGDSVD